MEILKKTGIESQEGAVPKIIETPKFLIINNQLYDKNTFEPLKLDILDYGDLNFSSWGPILRRSINTCCNVGNNYFQLGVNNLHYHMIEDSDYPDIFYLISQKGNCGSWFRAYKECVDKETGKHYYERLMNHTLGEYFNAYCNMIYYGGDYEIFYQNSDYIFGKLNEPHGVDGAGWSNWGTNYNHLFKLSKSTYTFTLLQSVHGIGDASYNHYFLKHDSAYDYVYVQYMAEHYKNISDINANKASMDNFFICPYGANDSVDINKLLESKKVITVEDLYNKYAPAGFNVFKINGRTAHDYYLSEYYLYYLVKPEYQDTVRDILSETFDPIDDDYEEEHKRKEDDNK